MKVAHIRDDGVAQPLKTHLEEAANIAGENGGKAAVSELGRLAALSHDFGKYSAAFQAYIRSATGQVDQDSDEYVDAAKARGKIDHSSAGAQLIWREFARKGRLEDLLGQILALCVASHHSGLIDCITPDGTDAFGARMTKESAATHFDECLTSADDSFIERWRATACSSLLRQQLRQAALAIGEAATRALPAADAKLTCDFHIGLLTRFVFSCVLDADRLSTACFVDSRRRRVREQSSRSQWTTLCERLEAHLAGLPVTAAIDTVRRDVSSACRAAAARERSLYTLTVPTGGGKTLASLRFALNHAAHHKMDHVIYVIPFTTIIDQNARTARSILEPEGVEPGSVVLEHHSNLMPEQVTWRNKLLSENWDAPVIFTTMVQLLDTLFAGGTRAARRMHQLANAVLVFDEIQSLPLRCVHLFNQSLNFLVAHCGSSALLCTATQPLLHRVNARKGALWLDAQRAEIAPANLPAAESLHRVEIRYHHRPGGWTNDDVARLALGEAAATGSCLVVVNTKSAARDVFRVCSAESDRLHAVYLSTNLCPAHRKQRIAGLESLLPASGVVCVSTQLIEAGVDLDFGAAIRYLAGIDSIVQTAGRCNRHGLRSLGRVSIVNSSEPLPAGLSDIDVAAKCAEQVLDELGIDTFDPNDPAVIERYYSYYFFRRAQEMDYPVKCRTIGREDTLLRLLSGNTLSVRNTERPLLKQAFRTAGEVFSAIDAPTRGIVVPYTSEGRALIAELFTEPDAERLRILLGKAQQFTVNVYPHTLTALRKEKAVSETSAGVLCLDERYYDDNFGLSVTTTREMEFLHYGLSS